MDQENTMLQRLHLSVQIENTTGPAYIAKLGKLYGPERVLLYDNHQQTFHRLSESPVTIGQSVLKTGRSLLEKTPLVGKILPDREGFPGADGYPLEDLPEDAAAVHGHFTPDLLEGKVESTLLTIVLREPLERMIKQYLVWVRKEGRVNWRKNHPYDPELSFEDFAFLKKYRNYQSQYLGDLRLGDFDVVGVLEQLEIHLCQIRGEDWSHIQIKNNKPGYRRLLKDKKLGLTEELIEEFKEYHLKDYAIYNQAKAFMGY
jgi:hypothetical protein